jgi:hypothetical protein
MRLLIRDAMVGFEDYSANPCDKEEIQKANQCHGVFDLQPGLDGFADGFRINEFEETAFCRT